MRTNDSKQKKRRIRTVTRPAANGMWHRRFIVERVTQSLRRMIYDTPKRTYRIDIILLRYSNHTRDIYRYSILDDGWKLPHFLAGKNQAQ